MKYPELCGKRLLVLGGNSWKKAIKTFANENGIKIICAGNNPNAGINSIADEYYNVDSTNHDSMKDLISNKKIDGVYLGGNEIVISHACEYVNDLGLPCYCKKEQWSLMQNKEMFKQCCINAKLPVVPQYFIDENNISLSENIFPVITKPVDGYGSNGFSVCKNVDELINGYLKAKNNSLSGKVLVEKFVRNQGNVVFYTVTNGRIVFSGLSDKYPVRFKEHGSYVGGLFVYESKNVDEFRSKYESKIQQMINNIGIKEGTFWIEVFHDGCEYYFNEAGYRYGGSVSIYPVDYLYNINQVASDIYYALTGVSKIYGHSSLFDNLENRKRHYAIYPVYVSSGKISKIKISDKLYNENILFVILAHGIGEVINNSGSFGQAVMLIHIIFNSFRELKATINQINDNIIIYDENNNNMIIKMLDLKTIN